MILAIISAKSAGLSPWCRQAQTAAASGEEKSGDGSVAGTDGRRWPWLGAGEEAAPHTEHPSDAGVLHLELARVLQHVVADGPQHARQRLVGMLRLKARPVQAAGEECSAVRSACAEVSLPAALVYDLYIRLELVVRFPQQLCRGGVQPRSGPGSVGKC